MLILLLWIFALVFAWYHIALWMWVALALILIAGTLQSLVENG